MPPGHRSAARPLLAQPHLARPHLASPVLAWRVLIWPVVVGPVVLDDVVARRGDVAAPRHISGVLRHRMLASSGSLRAPPPSRARRRGPAPAGPCEVRIGAATGVAGAGESPRCPVRSCAA